MTKMFSKLSKPFFDLWPPEVKFGLNKSILNSHYISTETLTACAAIENSFENSFS